jgi:hypothetical protein
MMFVAAAQDNRHLLPNSPAMDAADDPGAAFAVNLDGDSCPQGMLRNMGTDEVEL